eukprot:420434-Prymnesium_polylepis.1
MRAGNGSVKGVRPLASICRPFTNAICAHGRRTGPRGGGRPDVAARRRRALHQGRADRAHGRDGACGRDGARHGPPADCRGSESRRRARQVRRTQPRCGAHRSRALHSAALHSAALHSAALHSPSVARPRVAQPQRCTSPALHFACAAHPHWPAH